MNVLDILLLLAAVWFAIIGYRQGFVVGILSVIGFLGGGLVAVLLLPILWDQLTDNSEVSTTATVVFVMVVIVCASVGQASDGVLSGGWGETTGPLTTISAPGSAAPSARPGQGRVASTRRRPTPGGATAGRSLWARLSKFPSAAVPKFHA